MGSGLANQVSNPDVDVDITKPDMVIRRQIAVLKEMTSWLKAAYTGNDISFNNGIVLVFHFIIFGYTWLQMTSHKPVFNLTSSCSSEDAGSGEESGSGCDSPPCDSDGDIYFSTPSPIKPRIVKVKSNSQPSSGTQLAPCSLALAAALLLALLALHTR